jgi:hypothetical protein
MNRSARWIAAVAAAWMLLACDPKTPKPTEPPKPIAQVVHHQDDLAR